MTHTLIALVGVILGFLIGFAVGSALRDSYYKEQAVQYINQQLWRIKLGEITTRDIHYL